ncbi:IclR family transcriptional regulator [Sphingomonas carotinifaciens]|uniref:IclR family transcriptional regulator n=1 Tax=Sphingomonas carotinifaciens TaxID=1166323 RepID=UPI000DD577CB|nr:helix-turn-helix domain-containing protein [Sphingomonas carotinifaciens]
MQRRVVKSAARTLEVLELFAERREPMHLNEIYIALGYPQSSTTNLLKSMVIGGYLNYNRKSRTYLPTDKVSQLGNWIAGYVRSHNNYRDMLLELQRRTDETVGLQTQNDLYIQYLYLHEPDHAHKNVPVAGTMRLMVNSAGGRAMLSRMPDRTIDKICRYTNHYELCSPRINTTDFMREIAWIRQTGYAYLPNMPTPDVSAICFPLTEDVNGTPMAVGVGGLAERISRNKSDIVSIMREVIARYRPVPSFTSTPPDAEDGAEDAADDDR